MRAGYLTINEARKMQKLDPLPDGDVLLIPLNLVPTNIDEIYKEPEPIPANEPLPNEQNPSKFLSKLTPSEWEDEYAEGIPHWATDMNPSLFAQEFVGELKKNKLNKILEIGCGCGRDSIFFSRADMNVTAIDVAPSAIELAQSNAAKEEITNIRFMVANIENSPFGDNEFEAAFTLSVLHSTNLKKSIPEVARVLRQGGLAFIYLYADTEFIAGKIENHITVDDFTALLKDNEFEILDFYTEQEDEFDEFGEKHRIIVTLLRR
jgi:SAM-dependent methyltransferase